MNRDEDRRPRPGAATTNNLDLDGISPSPDDRVVATRALLARGFAVIPVPPRSKNPDREGWPNWRLGPEEVEVYFNNGENIGVLLGAPSNGLIDVDLDCAEALRLADALLPRTGAVFGRKSKPRSHRLYRCDDLPSTFKAQHRQKGKMGTLVELRSTGTQTIVPNSIHPEGEPIEWAETGEPAKVGGAELRRAVQRLAAAALLASSWPEGARHDAALALSGGLLRDGWPLEEALAFVRAVAEAAGDEETTDRLRAVRDTAERLAREQKATGWTTLASLIGEREVGKAREWLSAGGTKEQLERLVDEAPEWTPPPAEDGAALLDDIASLYGKYVWLSPASRDGLSLWTVHTYCIDAAEATPYVSVRSAEKRSGKTRTLEVAEQLVWRPWLTGRVTAAVLVRKIDAERPSLLLDESDAAFKGDPAYAEALRGVLNSGHKRSGRVSLCVGQGANISYRDFSTFGAKMIAGIGELPDTVADRSIAIVLKRRAPAEQVSRFRARLVKAEAAPLRERLERWAAANRDALRDAQPALPDQLDDRAQDAWEPLLAIADVIGGEWPERARDAAKALSAGEARHDDSIGVCLLRDIRRVFEKKKVIATKELVDALASDEASPWSEWRDGEPITPRALAKLLRPYGIHPDSVRIGEKTPKGYARESFEDAWARYLPATDSPSATAQQPAPALAGTALSIRNTTPHVADAKHGENPPEHTLVADVADRKPDQAQTPQPEDLQRAADHARAELDKFRPYAPIEQLSAVDPQVMQGDPATWPDEHQRWLDERVCSESARGVPAAEARRQAVAEVRLHHPKPRAEEWSQAARRAGEAAS